MLDRDQGSGWTWIMLDRTIGIGLDLITLTSTETCLPFSSISVACNEEKIGLGMGLCCTHYIIVMSFPCGWALVTSQTRSWTSPSSGTI